MKWQTVSFDWNQARAFLVTAEEGSLSAAARALGLTQPTLSRQVAALEENLGVVLFERVGRSLTLTEPGHELLAHVRQMGEAAGRISLAALGQAQAVEGKVCISASDLAAVYMLPAKLDRLRRIAPGIDIEIVASNALSDLRRREADIAIRHVRPEEPDLIARLVRESSAHLYASTSYLERHGYPQSPADLQDAHFIGFQDYENHIQRLNDHGMPVSRSNFKYIVDSGVVYWEMARKGLGMAIMADDIARMTPGVEQVLPELMPFPVPYWLTAHRELHTSKRIRLVFDTLAEILSKPVF